MRSAICIGINDKLDRMRKPRMNVQCDTMSAYRPEGREFPLIHVFDWEGITRVWARGRGWEESFPVRSVSGAIKRIKEIVNRMP